MGGLKVAAAATEIQADDSMVIGGSINPWFASKKEGELRASVVIIEKEVKVVLISCDALALQRDILDGVCGRIGKGLNISPENVLIAATHTHHAPTTVSVHGYQRDERFCANLKKSIISTVRAAEKKLEDSGEARMYFWLGNEATVGQNSRLLLKDGTIYWVGPREDALRPTGPFDPDLPVISFRKANGNLEALVFNHSTHNIGTTSGSMRSPGFYGLASQDLEKKLGGTVIFLPGSFGSTHNLLLSADEMIIRIKDAIEGAFLESTLTDPSSITTVKREFEYRVRKFDEESEEKAVSYYCNKRLKNPEPTIQVFRRMRSQLSEHQGESRRSWLQVILLGDIALVGVPGELFTELGIQIKRRSPFRHTYVVGLSNDYIGYIPDERAFDLGGYQVWTGFHSFVDRGTGESIVNQAVQMLHELHPPS